MLPHPSSCFYLRQRRLGLRQPEGHGRGAVEVDGGGQLSLAEIRILFTEAHVEGVWVRSTFLRTVGYFIPSVVETQCLTDHQVIGVHTIDLMQFHVPRA